MGRTNGSVAVFLCVLALSTLRVPSSGSAPGPWSADDSPFFIRGWGFSRGRHGLPGWYEDSRTHGHTEIRLTSGGFGLDTPVFLRLSARFRELGAHAFVRHVKTCSEQPPWPSLAPLGPGGEPLFDGDRTIRDCNDGTARLTAGRHVPREMAREAHEAGSRMIGYHWIMSDETIATLHPEWVCKRVDRVHVYDHAKGPFLDITSPYREVVLVRLLELAESGVDAAYFDNRHMPMAGCFATPLDEGFRLTTGMEAPTRPDHDDPLYRLFLQFQAYKVEETFSYWRAAVKARYPDFALVVGGGGLPALIDYRFTSNLARLADAAKTEYFEAQRADDDLPGPPDASLATPRDDLRMALGWAFLRDASAPAHVWSTGAPNRDHALGFAASIMTYGGVAAVNVGASTLDDPPDDPEGATPREAARAVFELGQRVSPYLSGSRPVRWAGVHFSELSRNRRGGDFLRAWSEVLWPVLGAFGVLTDDGLPVGIVNDRQLAIGELSGYRLLFLPNPGELTTNQLRSVGRFAARGGWVLTNRPSWRWSDPERSGEAHRALRHVVRLVRWLSEPRVRVTGGPRGLHGVAYENRDGRLAVAVTNDYRWVQIQPRPVRVGEGTHYHDGLRVTDEIHPPPPPVRDAVVVLRDRRRPSRIVEVLSGLELDTEETPSGLRVRLPEFQYLALVVVER
jgi:hypothetical protein